ncbi:hypothetical protein RUM44_003489 [Polyplax serrata]|uniref:Uncharacterized protein n=1 Tax=Polyplax serrata TaxID=468196 RepID=A0ABR1AGL5_POLSC
MERLSQEFSNESNGINETSGTQLEVYGLKQWEHGRKEEKSVSETNGYQFTDDLIVDLTNGYNTQPEGTERSDYANSRAVLTDIHWASATVANDYTACDFSEKEEFIRPQVRARRCERCSTGPETETLGKVPLGEVFRRLGQRNCKREKDGEERRRQNTNPGLFHVDLNHMRSSNLGKILIVYLLPEETLFKGTHQLKGEMNKIKK